MPQLTHCRMAAPLRRGIVGVGKATVREGSRVAQRRAKRDANQNRGAVRDAIAEQLAKEYRCPGRCASREVLVVVSNDWVPVRETRTDAQIEVVGMYPVEVLILCAKPSPAGGEEEGDEPDEDGSGSEPMGDHGPCGQGQWF